MSNVNSDNSTTWTNYGDVNPIEHGGIFVQQENETTFRIVILRFYDDLGKNILHDLDVDVSSDWIDIKGVEESCDVSFNDKLHFAIACTWYYSPAEFGGHEDIHLTLEESEEYLKRYGIDLDNV